MITEEQKLATLGFVTMLIQSRKQLNNMERAAAGFLEDIGAQGERSAMRVIDYVAEATYNSGDDPELSAKELLEAVGLVSC